MDLATIQDTLAQHRQELEALGVARLHVFGSVARGEAGPTSDIDLLIELNSPMGLFAFAGIKLRLEEIFGAKVDLVMPEALKPQVREQVLQEAVRAA